LKLNGTHQLLAYVDDVNILGGGIHTLKENAEAVVAATRENGLEVSADKTKCLIMSRDQNVGRIQSVRIDNSAFERVEEFKYLGTTLTNQNSVAEEIKSRLKSGNACYHSVQNLLSSRLLSKNLKTKLYGTIILPVVLYGCEAWSLKLREERKLMMFENMVLRRTFGPRRDEVTGEWRRLHYDELIDLYPSPNIVRVIKSRRMRWAGHVARMGEERGCIRSWWGNRRERDHWGELGADGWIILGRISRSWDVCIFYMDWNGLAQDRDRWWTLVSAVMNLPFP